MKINEVGSSDPTPPHSPVVNKALLPSAHPAWEAVALLVPWRPRYIDREREAKKCRKIIKECKRDRCYKMNPTKSAYYKMTWSLMKMNEVGSSDPTPPPFEQGTTSIGSSCSGSCRSPGSLEPKTDREREAKKYKENQERNTVETRRSGPNSTNCHRWGKSMEQHIIRINEDHWNQCKRLQAFLPPACRVSHTIGHKNRSGLPATTTNDNKWFTSNHFIYYVWCLNFPVGKLRRKPDKEKCQIWTPGPSKLSDCLRYSPHPIPSSILDSFCRICLGRSCHQGLHEEVTMY